ncbi:urea carboxylase-associated protein 1 [Hartmannibacter diazotrophicus]|uniref:Urea carboxylase-associated protein 1 n=1 Tax=Hartmannibacter diazotrophicus TaxID=1482074 RepID=A0A2C9D990_9HYPH|nr:urea carboxylase-associated protein 1 [Hartmannibacter diazotrophicus]
MSDLITIPARRGKAYRVAKGETIKVINTHGDQVIDTWAFNADDLHEFMSMEHSRAHILKIVPAVGDTMRTNKRRPILTFVEDTSGGVHDTIIAACDKHRYSFLGHEGYHDNCEDNLHAAMHDIGLEAPETPSPLNLFMNIPVQPDRSLSFEAPVSTPGCYVRLKAEMDLIIAFSACPQDILPINGVGHMPTEAHFTIES